LSAFEYKGLLYDIVPYEEFNHALGEDHGVPILQEILN
jgi:hypothetical protein